MSKSFWELLSKLYGVICFNNLLNNIRFGTWTSSAYNCTRFQLTMEKEQNKTINFLDKTITYNNNENIETN